MMHLIWPLCSRNNIWISVLLISDINECADGIADCGPNAECFNSVGGYSCICEDGYISSDGNKTFIAGQGVQCIGKKLLEL